ncbi:MULTISPECIES: aldo/keto reductase [unclassified Streptomyces]|uniref:aldo/keto reductase n=1 Tax=unclassified Streptomyces TaxID=2593676 RepID=UPI00211CDE55|nr:MULTISPECIES: aldo/keto reductase [unclassified Streptomyces]
MPHKVVRAQAEAGMRRLGTDHHDVYFAHIEDRHTPLDDTVATFASLVTDGPVRVIGCSNHAAWRIAKAREIARAAGLPGFTCVQQRHTYLRPRPGADFGVNPHISDELLDYAREEPDLTVLS